MALGLGNRGRSIAISTLAGEVLTGDWKQDIDMGHRPEFRTLSIPTETRARTLVAAAPKAPNRMLPQSIALDPSSGNEPSATPTLQAVLDDSSESLRLAMPREQAIPDTIPALTGSNRELEDLRETLRSTQEALDRSYETTKQLEEAVARMKAVLAIQEARAKQADLDQRRNKTLPKTP
jgi:hypothetical protein